MLKVKGTKNGSKICDQLTSVSSMYDCNRQSGDISHDRVNLTDNKGQEGKMIYKIIWYRYLLMKIKKNIFLLILQL
jgi:hypothetical protein